MVVQQIESNLEAVIIEWLAAQQGGEVIVQGTQKAAEFFKKWCTPKDKDKKQ